MKKVGGDTPEERAWNGVLKLIGRRPRTEAELKTYFNAKGVSENIYEVILERLKGLSLVDDVKFSQWWVEQRKNFRPRSKIMIQAELTRKGVDKEKIKKAIVGIDEQAGARELLVKMEKRWLRVKGVKRKEKAYQYLSARGFEWEVIRRVVEEWLPR